MGRRHYSSSAADTTLSGSITAGATSMDVGSITGHPVQYPYTLILDPETPTEEVVEVTGGAGTTLDVTRGVDGTTGLSHSAGAVVRHGVSARDYDEPNEHINSTDGVHGVTGDVVGTSDTQTLTGKTIDLTDNTVNGTLAEFSAAVSDADLVGVASVQTLTGKTIDLTDNTVTGTLAEFNTAVSDADIAEADGGTVTPQASTSGTWTTSSASGYWRQAGGICTVWGRLTRSSGGLEAAAQLIVYANVGPPEFVDDLSGQVVGTFTMNGYGEGSLVAGAALTDGFAARQSSDGAAFEPTFSGAAVVSFCLSYPV